MATVLALSSSVARGHVGLSALLPVMQRLGHEVIALPTVVLSNHPGHEASSGFRVSVEALESMLAALQVNGWLKTIDAVVTGYLPSPEHVAFAASALHAVSGEAERRPLYFCDPVFGDLPHGLYVDEAAATAILTTLLPLADVLAPNAFELGWLAGTGEIQNTESAVRAARTLNVPHVLSTSVPFGQQLTNVLLTPENAFHCPVKRRTNVPHGTGDVLAAQIAARCIGVGRDLPARDRGLTAALVQHLGEAVAATSLIIEGSVGSDELALISSAPLWEQPQPLAISKL